MGKGGRRRSGRTGRNSSMGNILLLLLSLMLNVLALGALPTVMASAATSSSATAAVAGKQAAEDAQALTGLQALKARFVVPPSQAQSASSKSSSSLLGTTFKALGMEPHSFFSSLGFGYQGRRKDVVSSSSSSPASLVESQLALRNPTDLPIFAIGMILLVIIGAFMPYSSPLFSQVYADSILYSLAFFSNPGDISFQSFLTDLTFREHLKAVQDGLGLGPKGSSSSSKSSALGSTRAQSSNPGADQGTIVGTGIGHKGRNARDADGLESTTTRGGVSAGKRSSGAHTGSSAVAEATNSIGGTDHPAADPPHVLSFANHLSISVKTPAYKRYDYKFFSIVNIARRVPSRAKSIPGGTTAAAGASSAQQEEEGAGNNCAAQHSKRGGGSKAKAKRHASSSAAPSGGKDARRISEKHQASNTTTNDSTPVPANNSTSKSEPVGMLSAVEERSYWFLGIFGQWFVGTPGWSASFLQDAKNASDPWFRPVEEEGMGGAEQQDAAWGVISMANEFQDECECRVTASSKISRDAECVCSRVSADYNDGELRALEAGRLGQDGRQQQSSSSTERAKASSPLAEEELPPLSAQAAAQQGNAGGNSKMRKRKNQQKRERSTPSPLPPPSASRSASLAEQQCSKPAADPSEAKILAEKENRHRKQVAPSSAAAAPGEVRKDMEDETQQKKIVTKDTSELESLVEAVASSKVAVGELETQLAHLQTSNESTRASLQQQLEELRAKKKEEDSVRLDLRGKMKGLDENKRVAELHRKEAERKLKIATSAREGYQSRTEKKSKEAEELQKKVKEALAKAESSMQERTTKEAQMEQDRLTKETEMQSSHDRFAELQMEESALHKQLLAAKSGLEQARLRLRQRRATAFEAAAREASLAAANAAAMAAAAQRQQQRQQIQPQHQDFSTASALGRRRLSIDDGDMEAHEAFFDPSAVKDQLLPNVHPSLMHTGDYPHTSHLADASLEAQGRHLDYLPLQGHSGPPLVAPLAVQRFAFDARPDDYADAEESFHDAEVGQMLEVPPSFINGGMPPLDQQESMFYTADPATMMPPTPISPFSTGLLPSNLFQNLDDDARVDLVSPSHVNSTFARFGIDPAQSDDESVHSDAIRAMAEAAQQQTPDEPDSASEKDETSKSSGRAVANRRSWWSKRASRDPIPEVSETPSPGLEASDGQSANGDVEGKRRSFGMFPKRQASFGMGRSDRPANRSIPTISRPIGPLIPLNHTAESTVSADYEAVRRAFQLPVGAEDDESGRRSWSAFDNWQANAGARRAMIDASIAQKSDSTVPYDPRFSTDSLPLALQQRPGGWAKSRWQAGAGVDSELARTTSAEVTGSEAGSSLSRGRGSRFAFWSSSPGRSADNPVSTTSQASDAEDPEVALSSPMARTPSRRKFWNRRSEAEVDE